MGVECTQKWEEGGGKGNLNLSARPHVYLKFWRNMVPRLFLEAE